MDAVARRVLQAKSTRVPATAQGTAIDPIRRSATALILLCLSGMALAAGPMSFLQDTAFSKFNDRDVQLFKAALDKALASPGEGVPVAWANERSDSSGAITPEGSEQQGGAGCRDLRIANRHKTLAGEAVYRFCRTGTGPWKLVQ